MATISDMYELYVKAKNGDEESREQLEIEKAKSRIVKEVIEGALELEWSAEHKNKS